MVVIASNRGQVGSFNSNLFTKLAALETEYGTEVLDYVVIGRKAMDIAIRLGRNVVADFEKMDASPVVDQIEPLAAWLVGEFGNGRYRAVYVVYNHFISTLSQQSRVFQLLPLVPKAYEQEINNQPTGSADAEYLFEPSPEAVLRRLLPRIVESQMFQMLLESDASEHSARMVTMKNATENAGDLILDLTLTFNQLRQNRITTELSEITAGKLALEQ